MADIGVFHKDLSSIGGSQAVCMNILDALEEDHTITLYTTTCPNFGKLNNYFGTHVSDISVDHGGVVSKLISHTSNLLSKHTELGLSRLKHSVLNRSLDCGGHDVVISASNEFSYQSPAIQYIHYPIGEVDRNNFIYSIYDRVCESILEYDKDRIRKSTMITNSNWTANAVREIYDVSPDVVYPPINANGFNKKTWEEREVGFVSIGRVTPDKMIHRNFEIVSQIRQRGQDVHIHHVGPIPDDEYGKKIRKIESKNEYIYLEERLPRQKLIDLICSHRYGIHGKKKEHFGMAVAELVAGGTLPFVPNGGGQCEIVNNIEDLLYDDINEGIRKIDTILDSHRKQKRLQKLLPDVETQYSREQFHMKISEKVNQCLTADNS
jgi:glycosyltransferase involved in cell wall biosynthesis